MLKAELQIIESPRFFEALLKGRSIFEAQHITSRICGICACGHSLASIQAGENAIGFLPSEQTLQLRGLLLMMENLDSHLLHLYLLVAPDLLGVESFLGMMDNHADAVKRALRMKNSAMRSATSWSVATSTRSPVSSADSPNSRTSGNSKRSGPCCNS